MPPDDLAELVPLELPDAVDCVPLARFEQPLAAGVKDVRMYFGSWNEWSRDDKFPIESGHPAVPSASAAA